MRRYLITVGAICLLVLAGCGDSEPEQQREAGREPAPEVQAGLLAAVPSNASAFAAVKSPQGVIDRFKALMPALKELEEPLEDPLAPIREVLGDVDLSGPAALVVLDLADFDKEEEHPPIAFLVSAADAEAVVAAHKEVAGEDQTDLPAGVVKLCTEEELDVDLYLAAKGEFVVVALDAESAEKVSKSDSSMAVLPEVQKGYDEGKIVAQADMDKIRPFLIEKCFNQTRADIAEAEEEGSAEDTPGYSTPGYVITVRNLSLLYFDIIEALLEQYESLIYIVDLNDKGVFWTGKTIFKDGSALSEFAKGHMGKGEPSYEGLPRESFIVAGAAKILPGELDTVMDTILEKAKKYPRLQAELETEAGGEIVASVRNFCGQVSGMAFTGGMGSPATGMLSVVSRFDVADAGAFKEQIKTLCQSGLAAKLTEATGIELVYNEAVENYEGVDIDTVRIGLAEFDESEGESEARDTGEQAMKVMPMVIGPDLSIRVLAANDKQVLIVISGGYTQAERVINVIKGYGSSLAGDAKISGAVKQMPANRLAEVHYDFGQVLGLVKHFSPDSFGRLVEGSEGLDIAAIPLISGCGAVEENAYREDMIVPADFVRSFVGIFITAFSRSTGAANAAVCATNLKGLDTALYLYAHSHEKTYPDPARWKEILIEEDLAPPMQFICPGRGGDPETENHYVFVPWPGPDEVDGSLLVLFEKEANHDGRRNVVDGAHGVSRVTEAEFQEMLARTMEALEAKGIEFDWQE